MLEAKVTDFKGMQEASILKRSRLFYVFRIGGFLITVVGSSIIILWGFATENISFAFPIAFLLVLVGLAMFIASWNATNYCRQCQNKVETFYCTENRPNGRYSGQIFVCNHCNSYEVRLNYESS